MSRNLNQLLKPKVCPLLEVWSHTSFRNTLTKPKVFTTLNEGDPVSKPKRFKFSLNPQLREKLELETTNTGKSLSDLINEAIDHWFKCDKGEPVATMKLILLRYPADCKKCNKNLEAGTWALWGRGFGAICLDCYIKRIGDKTLITKELKVRQLKHMKKSLEEEIEGMFAKYSDYSAFQEIDKTGQLIQELHDIIMDYLKQNIGSPEEIKILEEVLKFINDAKTRLADIADWLMKPKKKKKVKYEV